MQHRLDVRRYSAPEKNEMWQVHDEALRDSAMDFSPEYNRYLRHVESEFLEVGGEFLVATLPLDAVEGGAASAESERVVAIGGFQPLSYLVDTYSEAGLPSLDVPIAETCRVRSVAVLPEFQSEGVGTELMDELEGRAAEAGFEQTVLKTTESLQRAQRFYESRGYQSVGSSEDSGTDYVWYLKEVGE